MAERVLWHQPKHPLKDHSAIRRILRATNGFPLGIELIAAQVRDYSLQEIAEGLEKSLLDWQRTQKEDVHLGPQRHESLESCLDWSISRLPSPQRAKFYQLSVFPSSFTSLSAHKVCGIVLNLRCATPSFPRRRESSALRGFLNSRLRGNDGLFRMYCTKG